jgi:hypothetical protein
LNNLTYLAYDDSTTLSVDSSEQLESIDAVNVDDRLEIDQCEDATDEGIEVGENDCDGIEVGEGVDYDDGEDDDVENETDEEVQKDKRL